MVKNSSKLANHRAAAVSNAKEVDSRSEAYSISLILHMMQRVFAFSHQISLCNQCRAFPWDWAAIIFFLQALAPRPLTLRQYLSLRGADKYQFCLEVRFQGPIVAQVCEFAKKGCCQCEKNNAFTKIDFDHL